MLLIKLIILGVLYLGSICICISKIWVDKLEVFSKLCTCDL